MPRLVSFNVVPRVLLLSNITAAAGWVSFGVWSHLGVKKVLAMPGLVSFNFKLMSEHPFHFPMAVLTPSVFYFSEEVCRIYIMPKVTPNLITNSPFDFQA